MVKFDEFVENKTEQDHVRNAVKVDTQVAHSKLVCSSFSKFAQCENEQTCPSRHPTGACIRWKKGVCNKNLECFYRHPEGEEGSEGRKRMLSGKQSPQANKSQNITEEDHFLFQKVMEKFLEEKKLEKKEESIPAGWMNARWSPAPTPSQFLHSNQ